ncbi:hypothetical protein IAT38_003026 [Cryptococcus sp. DSM 104549]
MLVLPKSSTFVAIASLCAMALPALAQDMIFVKAENGVTFDVDGDSRTGQTSYEFIGSLNGAFTVNLPDGSRPHCTMSGTYNQATFTLTPGPGYLHPCGPNNGVTLTCTGPESTC